MRNLTDLTKRAESVATRLAHSPNDLSLIRQQRRIAAKINEQIKMASNTELVSPYFQPNEFVCAGKPCIDMMDEGFLRRLVELRDRCAIPFKITSSWRSPQKNRAVGGAVDSMHLKGRAVDISCPDSSSRAIIIREALAMGLTVGVMENAVHIDNRDGAPIVFHYYHLYRKK